MDHSEMSAVLATDRLLLRPLRASDAPAIAEGIGDWEVARWLPRLPWPYAVKDAEDFMRDPVSIGAWLIEIAGEVAGMVHIGVTGELGYWLARAFHGHGYMTEAAGALVAQHFAFGGGDLISGYLLGNGPSCNVLTKLGFSNTHIERKPSRPLNAEVDVQRMVLTASDWAARHPLVIDTARLRLRPFTHADVAALSAMGVPEVARMMTSIGAPWPVADVLNWIGKGRWRGCPGFRLALCLKDGTLIGGVGLGGEPMTCAYFLGPADWGKGYATEAMRGLLADAFTRFGLDEITADAFDDNPASQAVLRKLGFTPFGSQMGSSKARLEPAPITLYRLTKAAFKAANP